MKFVFLLFAVLACASAATIPEFKDKEVLYKYEADFRTGVNEPNSYGSHFHIKADLHGQFDEQARSVVFYFSDVKIAVYNGELTMDSKPEHEKFVPLSEELKAFEHPFMVVLAEHNGLFKEVITSAEEPKWIINIKKSVVSLFQFNWETFDANTSLTTPTAYISDEDTIYGECKIAYAVKPQGEQKWIVTKYFDPKQCTHHYKNLFYTVESKQCDSEHDYEDTYLNENYRVYHIAEHKTTKDAHYFEKIESTGKMLFNPLRSSHVKKYLIVKQTVDFVKYQDMKKIELEHKIPHKLDISFEDMTEEEVLETTFFTYTTYHVDDDKKTKSEKCLYGLEKLAKNYSNADYYNYVIHELSYLTVEDFELCAKSLVGLKDASHTLETYYKILPLIGTKASVNYIKKIIKTDTIKPMTAISLLKYMPFYVLVPTEQLLTDLKEFIDPNFVTNVDVKTAAVHAYATLIYKTYNMHPESPVLRKYIKTYYTYLKTATTYSEQLMWLQGLNNIEVGYVWELLLPIINGEQVLSLTYDYHLREHAIWASYKSIARKHPTEYYNVLWPIILNEDLHTNLRIAAVRVYLYSSSSMVHLQNLFLQMHNETNVHVLNFFVTSLEELSKSPSHCQLAAKKYADLALEQFSNEGSHVKSYSYSHEHIDEEYGFGGQMYGGQIADSKTNIPNSFYVGVEAYALYKKANMFAFYFKFEGANSVIDMFTKRPLKTEKIHYEFMSYFNDKIVFTKYVNEETIKDLDIQMILQNKNEFVHIMDLFNYKALALTDLGLPLVITVQMPVLTKVEFNKELSDFKYDMSLSYEQTLNGYYGRSLYNPFSKVWHGIVREVKYDLDLDLHFDIGKDGFSMTLNDPKKPNQFYGKTEVETIVYMVHEKNPSLLDELCKNCTYNQITTEHSKYLYNNEDLHECKEFGLDYKLEVTNCQGPYEINYSANELLSTLLTKFGKVDFSEYMIHVYNFVTLHLLSPQIYSCGHSLTIVPSELYPVEKYLIEFNDLLKTYTNTSTTYEFNPTFKVISTDKQLSKTYETKFDVEIEKGFIVNEFSGEFRRIVKSKPTLNVCFDYQKTYENGGYYSYFNYYEGFSFEHECVKDQFFVNIYTTSSKSDEQKALDNTTHTYYECDLDQPLTMDCIKAYTSLRYDSYQVEYKNLPLHHKTFFQDLFKTLKHRNSYDVEEVEEKTMLKNTFTVDVVHSVYYDLVDVTIYFPHITYTVNSLYYPSYLGDIENTHFIPKHCDKDDQFYSCLVRTDEDVKVGLYTTEEHLKDDNKYTTLFAIDNEFKVEVLKQHEQLKLKLTVDNSTMVVHYDEADEKYYYAMDESMLDSMMYPHKYDDETFGFERIEIGDTNVYLFSHYNVHVVYTHEYVKIETEDLRYLKQYKVTGKCF